MKAAALADAREQAQPQPPDRRHEQDGEQVRDPVRLRRRDLAQRKDQRGDRRHRQRRHHHPHDHGRAIRAQQTRRTWTHVVSLDPRRLVSRDEPRRPRRRPAGRSSSARSASCSATSARARSTRSRRSSTRATRTRSPATTDSVFGIISLIFWSVTIIVTITYVLLVMRADNDGEGGIMALITLIRRGQVAGGRRTKLVLAALGHLRRLAVLRRQHDHAGDLGAVGGRGTQGRRAVARAPDRPDHRGDHRRPVPAAAARHGGRRAAVRPGDDRLVPRDRRVRGQRHRRPPGDPQGALADLRASASSSTTSRSRSSRSPRSCSPSPAPRRCTPTWGTSAARRSPAPG